jgi:flagellar basal body-associated protein FliL
MSDAATEAGNLDNNSQVAGTKKIYTWHAIMIGVGMVLLMIAGAFIFFYKFIGSRKNNLSILIFGESF